MSFQLSNVKVESIRGNDEDNFLTRNLETTAAVGIAVATGGIGGAVMLSVMPTTTIAAATAASALAYVGHEKAHGRDAFRFFKKSKEDVTPEIAEATATA